jgi:hypothetical protein
MPSAVVDFTFMRRGFLTALLLLAAGAIHAADPVLELRVTAPPLAGEIPEAVPTRFLLLDDGVVYVGGTSRVLAGKLTGKEASRIEKQADKVGKLPGLGEALSFGAGDTVYRLRLKKGTEILVRGDHLQAPAALKPLGVLIESLMTFDHGSLRAYQPSSYRLSAKEMALPGGCRAWSFPVPLADVVAGPKTVPAAAAAAWPTGGRAASVCSREKTFAVTLEPLLPGETLR